ncbi:MAG: hypothetical protein QM791_21160 [Ferruginibacter sp.]
MQFTQIINARLNKENDRPLMQKEAYPVSNDLQHYLQHCGRDIYLPVTYSELLHYRYSDAIKDEDGKHTHWENVVYEEGFLKVLEPKLIETFSLLKKVKDTGFIIKAIDFCEFANSMPFRVTLIDESNTTDCFYIKSADASRIYGLELEHLLSPNTINFLYHQNTLVEEHIEGTPGDVFLVQAEAMPADQKKLVAEAFVRFNERCFVRLLGDMRSYNFVVLSSTGQFHLRAIDFDQQTYEGKANLYLPQFYKENYGYVQMALELLGTDLIEAIRVEERRKLSAMSKRSAGRLTDLLDVMKKEEISENYKVLLLRKELDEYFKSNDFAQAKTMGDLVIQQLRHLLS